MKLSSKARYAVMAMTYLASLSKDERSCSLSTIAKSEQLPLSFLEQIFAKLRRADLVKSERGGNGGYVLSHAPQAISIFDIIVAVEPPLKATRCSHGKGCKPSGLKCTTHHLWEGLDRVVENYFKTMTLFHLIGKTNGGALFQQQEAPCFI